MNDHFINQPYNLQQQQQCQQQQQPTASTATSFSSINQQLNEQVNHSHSPHSHSSATDQQVTDASHYGSMSESAADNSSSLQATHSKTHDCPLSDAAQTRESATTVELPLMESTQDSVTQHTSTLAEAIKLSSSSTSSSSGNSPSQALSVRNAITDQHLQLNESSMSAAASSSIHSPVLMRYDSALSTTQYSQAHTPLSKRLSTKLKPIASDDTQQQRQRPPPQQRVNKASLVCAEVPVNRRVIEEKVMDGYNVISSESEVHSESMTQQVTFDYRASAELFYRLCVVEKALTFGVVAAPNEAPIFICNKDDSLLDVFRGLLTRNILSVPVLNPSTRTATMPMQLQIFDGFIDLMDIIKFVIHVFGAARLSRSDKLLLLEDEYEFSSKTVGDLLSWSTSKRNPFRPVTGDYSGFAVVESLARESLLRIPVLNSFQDRGLVNLVTESAAVQWFAMHEELLGRKRKKPIQMIQTWFKDVHSISDCALAIDAYNMMVALDEQAIAIVDESNRLTGNISMSDLKCVGADPQLFRRLHQPIRQFLQKVKQHYKQLSAGKSRPVVYVLAAATLGDVLHSIAQHCVHRVYIVKHHTDKQLQGVCTLKDLLTELIAQ